MNLLSALLIAAAAPAAAQVCVKDPATGKLRCMSEAQYEVRIQAPAPKTVARLKEMVRPMPPAAGETTPLGYKSAMALADAVRDRHSSSIGTVGNGSLRNAAELPAAGYGWRLIHGDRKRNFGTDGLVAGIIQVAAEMKKGDPAILDLAVSDLSAKHGGDVTYHKTHENGLDVDLVFYWTDGRGRPVQADRMVQFDRLGQGRGGVRFDTARNWRLAKTILLNPTFGPRVKHLLVAERLEKLLISHARGIGEDEALVRRAARLMIEPKNASDHSDHFHLRILPVPQVASSR